MPPQKLPVHYKMVICRYLLTHNNFHGILPNFAFKKNNCIQTSPEPGDKSSMRTDQ